jgi:hypothetical protein
MANFDELINDDKVSKHPLLSGYKNFLKFKDNMKKYTKLFEERKKAGQFGKLFSDKPEEDKSVRAMVFEASCVLNDVFSQFNLPVFPKISFINTKDIKYAKYKENSVVSGGIIFNVEFTSASGLRTAAVVTVPVYKGDIELPSVMEVNGRLYVIAQKSLDEILERVTSYSLPKLSPNWSTPPKSREERELMVSLRNETGYVPEKLVPKYSAKKIPKDFDKVIKMMEDAEKSGEDSFPRPYIYLLRNYVLEHVNVAEQDAWMPHLINLGFCINPYGVNVRKKKSQEIHEDLVEELGEPSEESSEEKGLVDLLRKCYPGTKTPIEVSDPVRFKDTRGDGIKGVIVDLDIENDFLIIKSKGMEYRIKVEDIEPLPSTFKKMYL